MTDKRFQCRPCLIRNPYEQAVCLCDVLHLQCADLWEDVGDVHRHPSIVSTIEVVVVVEAAAEDLPCVAAVVEAVVDRLADAHVHPYEDADAAAQEVRVKHAEDNASSRLNS